MRLRSFALILLLSASGAAQTATPSPAELESARRSFEAGLRLEDSGDFAGALEHFRRVAAVRLTPQVRYHLGVSLEGTGRFVEAARELDLAVNEARHLGPEGAAILPPAEQRLAQLRARTPLLVVRTAGGAAPPRVLVDGAWVSTGEGPAPIDPGAHELVAETPAGTYRRRIVAHATEPAEIVETTLPGGEPVTREPDAQRGSRAPVIVAASVGAAALALAGVTAILRNSALSDLEASCGTSLLRCPESARGDADSVRSLTATTNVALGVGVVAAVATGILFLVTWPRASRAPTTANGGGVLTVQF